MRRTRFRYIIILTCLSFFAVESAAQNNAGIPQQLTEHLQLLKKTDNLTDWIYSRIDHSYAYPKESLSFLMNTQQEAWRKAKSPAEKEAWLILLSNQAYNQLYSGNILSSINCYEQAYNYYQDNNLNADISEYILKPWANNYTRLGDYEKAIFIQQKTLDYAIREHNDELAAAVLNNLAISYRSIRNFKKAIECITLGKQKATTSQPINILLNNSLADIYKDRNEFNNAESIISKNIERQKKLKQNFETAYWLLSSYITAGDIQLAKYNFNAAQHYYLLGLETNNQYYKGNRLREKAYIITQLGKIKLSQKQGPAALNYFNQTLTMLGVMNETGQLNQKKIFGDNRLIDVFYQKSLAYTLLGKEKDALQNIRLSLNASDKIRFELADVKTKQRFQSETKQTAEQAVAMAFSLLEKTGQHQYAALIIDIIEQSKARTLLDDIRRNQQQLTIQTKDPLFAQKLSLERAIAYNEKNILLETSDVHTNEKNNADLKFKLEYIEKKIRAQYPSFAINIKAGLNDPDLLKALPSNSHFMEFFFGEENIYAIEIANKKVKQIKRITNAPYIKRRITDFVKTYYQNGPEVMMNKPKEFFNESYFVYKTLLGDFNITDGEQLIIIPDEVLGYLSFDGLITKNKYNPSIATWPYLIKVASVSYAFSIQTWIDQSKRKTTEIKKEGGFSGLFITHQNSGKQFIPAVAAEAASLKSMISGTYLMDKDAGLKNFFKAFDQADVLHISSHSYLSGEQKEPTLALNDNEVFLFELSSRKTAPKLVVLSACRTADGIMASGEGIISLSRGFAAIGTQGTIASLWNVNDDAAAKITAESYKNLLNNKKISTALHQAKLSWLNSRQNTAFEYLPYYWDALIFIGYDQQIKLPPANGLPTRYILMGITILTILIAFIVFMKYKK